VSSLIVPVAIIEKIKAHPNADALELAEVLGWQLVIKKGEVYGSKIQSFHYGHKGTYGFRTFDLLIDGRYVDWPEFVTTCETYGVETVPVVATISFSLAEVKRYSECTTLLM
jgi:hypothetical protein